MKYLVRLLWESFVLSCLTLTIFCDPVVSDGKESRDFLSGEPSASTRQATGRQAYYRTDRARIYAKSDLNTAEEVASTVVKDAVKHADSEIVGLLMSDGSVYQLPREGEETMYGDSIMPDVPALNDEEVEYYEEYYAQYTTDPSFVAVLSYDIRRNFPTGVIEFVTSVGPLDGEPDFMTLAKGDIEQLKMGRELRVDEIKKIPSNESIVDTLKEKTPKDTVLALVPPPTDYNAEPRSLYKKPYSCTRPGACGNPIKIPYKYKASFYKPMRKPRQYVQTRDVMDMYGRIVPYYSKVKSYSKKPYYLTPEFRYVKPSCSTCSKKTKYYPKPVKYKPKSMYQQRSEAMEYARRQSMM